MNKTMNGIVRKRFYFLSSELSREILYSKRAWKKHFQKTLFSNWTFTNGITSFATAPLSSLLVWICPCNRTSLPYVHTCSYPGIEQCQSWKVSERKSVDTCFSSSLHPYSRHTLRSILSRNTHVLWFHSVYWFLRVSTGLSVLDAHVLVHVHIKRERQIFLAPFLHRECKSISLSLLAPLRTEQATKTTWSHKLSSIIEKLIKRRKSIERYKFLQIFHKQTNEEHRKIL